MANLIINKYFNEIKNMMHGYTKKKTINREFPNLGKVQATRNLRLLFKQQKKEESGTIRLTNALYTFPFNLHNLVKSSTEGGKLLQILSTNCNGIHT